MTSHSHPQPAVLPVLGLIGGIGSGKSAAARILADLGGSVFDADAAVSTLLADPEITRQIADRFGPGVLAPDGSLDRKSLAAIVFQDAEARMGLESILHPPVIEAAAHFISGARAGMAPFVVLDVPLLLEAGMDRLCTSVLMISAPRSARLARVAARGWDEAELDRREAAQMPLDRKESAADRVIHNDSDLESLRVQLADAVDILT